MSSRFQQQLIVLVRSAGVGVVATLVDLSALLLLTEGLSLSVRLASPPSLLLGILVQFVGNKIFAFGDHSRAWTRQGVQFALVEILAAVVNLVLFDLAVQYTPIPYVAARLLITMSVYLGICFPLWTKVFRTPQGEFQ